MSDDGMPFGDTDHRHRNIAAIVEYLADVDVGVVTVTTPDGYGENTATFELIVPEYAPNNLREDVDGVELDEPEPYKTVRDSDERIDGGGA